MIKNLPAELIHTAKNILHVPNAIIHFKNYNPFMSINEDVMPELQGWLSEKENSRTAINSLNIDHQHTDDDKTHIYRYTAKSKPINNFLFGAKNDNLQVPSELPVSGYHNFSHDIQGLDSAIHRNRLKHDLVTYSGIDWNPAEKIQGGLLHLPAYTSTTLDKHIAYKFATGHVEKSKTPTKDMHIIRMINPVGSTGFYTHNDPVITQFDEEHEYVIPRGITVKINPFPKIVSVGDKKLHIWDAHRNPHGEPHLDTLVSDDPDKNRVPVASSGNITIYNTKTLSAANKHYPQFQQYDQGVGFHESHVQHPVYHIHTPEGVLQTVSRPESIRFDSGKGSLMDISDVTKKYPELNKYQHLFQRNTNYDY